MDDQRERAEAFLQQQNGEIQRLRPWIAAEGKLGRLVHGVPAQDVSRLTDDFAEHITEPLRQLIRRTIGFLGGDAKADAKVAAGLVVQGLCAALPAADLAGKDALDSMLGLCRMLKKQGCWAHLDALASGPCAALFDGQLGLYNLNELALDPKDGRWHLPKTLVAAGRRSIATGDLGSATSLLIMAHEEEGGCCEAAGPLAAAMCDALGRPAGAAWLAQLNEEHLQTPVAAICKHGGLQRAAQLMAALQQQQSVPSLALRVLALGVLQEAGRGEAAGFCASIPGFRAALCCVREGLATKVGAGQPREPAAWPVPEHIVARVQCSTSSDARQLCHVCRPVVDFMRCGQKETLSPIQIAEGEVQANIDHINSVLQKCARVCPILAKYFRHRAFPVDQVEGKGKKKLRRQVAAVRCWTVDTWHQDRVKAYREARQQEAALRELLDAVPEAAAAAAVQPAAPAALKAAAAVHAAALAAPAAAAVAEAAGPGAARGLAVAAPAAATNTIGQGGVSSHAPPLEQTVQPRNEEQRQLQQEKKLRQHKRQKKQERLRQEELQRLQQAEQLQQLQQQTEEEQRKQERLRQEERQRQQQAEQLRQQKEEEQRKQEQLRQEELQRLQQAEQLWQQNDQQHKEEEQRKQERLRQEGLQQQQEEEAQQQHQRQQAELSALNATLAAEAAAAAEVEALAAEATEAAAAAEAEALPTEAMDVEAPAELAAAMEAAAMAGAEAGEAAMAAAGEGVADVGAEAARAAEADMEAAEAAEACREAAHASCSWSDLEAENADMEMLMEADFSEPESDSDLDSEPDWGADSEAEADAAAEREAMMAEHAPAAGASVAAAIKALAVAAAARLEGQKEARAAAAEAARASPLPAGAAQLLQAEGATPAQTAAAVSEAAATGATQQEQRSHTVTASGTSTAKKRSAAVAGASTAKKSARKSAGPGSINRARLAKTAAQLRLPSLLLFFSPAHSHLSREQCSSLAQSQQASMGPLALSFAGEVQSKPRDQEAGSSAQPAASAASGAAGDVATAGGVPTTKRTRLE